MTRPKLAMGLVVLLCVPTVELNAEEPRIAPGYWWEMLDQSGRLSFVAGYVMAMQFQHQQFTLALNDFKPLDPEKPELPMFFLFTALFAGEEQKDEVKKYLQQGRESCDFGKNTNRQLVDGLDRLYSDIRNEQIPFPWAMDVVRAQIRGASDSEIEYKLETYRSISSGKITQ